MTYPRVCKGCGTPSVADYCRICRPVTYVKCGECGRSYLQPAGQLELVSAGTETGDEGTA